MGSTHTVPLDSPIGPRAEREPKGETMTGQTYREFVQALSEKLDETLIRKREETWGEVPYLDGSTVISQANKFFGFGRWERTITIPPTKIGIEKEGYFCALRVKVNIPEHGECVHEDVGYCRVSKEDGDESAIKGCVTDALKRCLRAFGAQFGNELMAEEKETVKSENGKRQDIKVEGFIMDYIATDGEPYPWEVEFIENGKEETQVLPFWGKTESLKKERPATFIITTSASGRRYIKSIIQ